MSDRSNVIDELLMSLKLETDASSFKKASDTINGIKSSMLQLAAATGTGMGFKAVTSDLADTVQGMMNLSRNTGLAVEKIRALKHSFAMLTGNGNDAVGFIQKMKQLQFTIDSHALNEKMYISGAFSPEKFNAEYKRDPMAAVRYYLEAVNREQDPTRRQELINSTIGHDEKAQAFLNAGIQHLDKSMQSWAQVGRNMPENLDADTELFIQRMGLLQTQFSLLAESIGSDLYPVINDVLGIISDFIRDNPGASKALAYGTMAGGTLGAAALLKGLFTRGAAVKFSGGGSAAAVAGGNALRRVPQLALAVGTAYMTEPLLDNALNTAFGNFDYFQRLRTAETRGDFGDALMGKGDAHWNGGKWIDNRGGLPGITGLANGGTSLPRGIRNNNPGNLNFAGQRGASLESGVGGRFATFESMDEGVAALHRQLGLYLKRGKNTISSIVKTYAPPSDGNNVDAYIQALSRKTGLDPNAVISAGDTQTMVNLMKGIIDHENGGNYLTKSDISRAINGGMNYDPVQYLSGYGAPVVSSTSNHSGGTINQTNHYNITAGGVDADGLVRRIKQEQSEDIHQALNMTMTDKF